MDSLAYLWLWLGRWAASKGLIEISDTCLRTAGAGNGSASVEALFRLGESLNNRKRFRDAVEVLQKAVSIDRAHSRAWCALGVCRRQLADMPEARIAYEQALAIDPKFEDACVNLGEWHVVSGDVPLALTYFDAVLSTTPGHHRALTNKAHALLEGGRLAEAEQLAKEGLRLFPKSAPLHVNLGNALAAKGQRSEAAECYLNALELEPESKEVAFCLATLAGPHGMIPQDLDYIQQQILLHGESPEWLWRLASAQYSLRQYGDTRETCERILKTHPEYIPALVMLSAVLGALGHVEEPIAIARKVLALNPGLPSVHSNILFDAHYSDKLTRQEVFDLHLEWARVHESPLLHAPVCQRLPAVGSKLDGNQAESRRLRIGYVSADFHSHPVGSLISDIILNHDKTRVETWCYSLNGFSDFVTQQIQSSADHWNDCVFLSDEELAKQIASDEIDILVDLSGHTAGNRLRVFAMRPAPVQASWIGYFHSTGLSSIDYFISDPHSTPPGGGQLFSEQPVYLPNSRFCFSPPTYSPDVADPPLERNGFITFGSFNRLAKLSPMVVETWAEILMAVPESHLLLKTAGLLAEEERKSVSDRFARHGVTRDRLDLRGESGHREMLEQYGEIDIVLDPFPFNGGMTTFEALWMGTPVVALRGDSVVSLQSASILTNIGLPELIFDSKNAYIDGAVALAQNHPKLRKLRREMRPRVAKSAICQPGTFAQDLEFLYARMWQAWIERRKLGMEVVMAPVEPRKKVLHVGCGGQDRRSMPQYFQGRAWQEIRLDINPDVQPDVVASMLEMTAVEDASVDAVYSSHNIEHLFLHEVSTALKEFRRVLKAEGLLVLLCPDIQSVCELVVADKLDAPAYLSEAGPIAPLDMLYGFRTAIAEGNHYMAHKTGFTATTLEKSLIEGGFEWCTIRRGKNFDLKALAYPAAPSDERIRSDVASCWPGDTQA